MKCDFCTNEATVHLTEIINGQVVEMHLCETCAKEKGTDFTQPFSAADLFQNFSYVLNEPGFIQKSSQIVCSNCGMTYADFSKSGRLGCGECYENFKKALLPLIKRVQRSVVHKGKRPVPGNEKGKAQLQVQRLQKQLENCIETENFEQAAKIRDEIKKLESRKKPLKKDGS
jgi:protein arginine kinase activator